MQPIPFLLLLTLCAVWLLLLLLRLAFTVLFGMPLIASENPTLYIFFAVFFVCYLVSLGNW